MNNAYHLISSEVLTRLESSEQGLTNDLVRERLIKNGPNILSREKPYSRLRVFVSQFKSPLIYILIAAAGLSFLAGEKTDAQVIAVAIFINVVIGYIQEDKANQALSKLKSMVEHRALVLRAGEEKEVPAAELVPGDVLVLRAGRFVLADARIFRSFELETNEASLTGESAAVIKSLNPDQPETPLADRKGMVYAGTSVISGSGLAVVVATGMKTEIGKISELVKKANNEATPLQERLAGISKFLGLAAIFVCLIVIAAGLINGFSFLEIFSSAAAIAVAAIPEGLAVAVTVILALGMKQTVKKKALTRNLLAAETLGSITVICSDKTGTLTEGIMQLETVVSASDEFKIPHLLAESSPRELVDFVAAFKIGLLCNTAVLVKRGTNLGSALEVSFLKSALNLGFSRDSFLAAEPRVAELPFSSVKKFMISLHQAETGYKLYEKGAGEIVLNKCSYFQKEGKVKPLTAKEKQALFVKYESLASSGFRVIALAYRDLEKLPFSLEEERKDWEAIDSDLIFVALAAFKDPLRKEAKKTISLCRRAGIRPIIITGDHAGTAAAIATELKISSGEGEVISGPALDQMDDKALRALVKRVSVYARVSPEHKIRIVKALKHNGEVVAMTGDGLNDSPALKAADIGVCLGSGTEVAKETADLVLLDDNFSVIVGAVRQGRIIFDNIRKSLTYIVSDSFSEMILILGSIIFHTPLALMPIQVLWINIVNDGLPNFSLAFEPGDEGVMDRRPIKRSEPIFNGEMKKIILGVGLIRDLLLFGLFYFFTTRLNQLGWSADYLRTLFFAILIFKSLFSIFSIRSFYLPIYKIKHAHNPYLFFAFGLGVILMMAAVYLPFLNRILKTVPLAAESWLVVGAVAIVNILMIEIVKYRYLCRDQKR